jgi:uncharacterized protein
MSSMELDGYLTGIAISPALIPNDRWLDGIWGQHEPAFDSLEEAQFIINAVMDHYRAIVAALDIGFEQLEGKKTADYRPLFLVAGGKPSHDIVRIWLRGFSRAAVLAAERWQSLAEDERMAPILEPFMDFLAPAGPYFETVDNVDALLDRSAAAIPRSTILLRKIAQFVTEAASSRRSKIGRNDPCACGSGRKYKRCCGATQASPS